MNIPIVPTPNVRLTPLQENVQAKPTAELYVGQVLKAVVVNALTENQVSLNINGQNINANSAYKFEPGDVLKIRVNQLQGQILFDVLEKNPAISTLQQTIAKNLPLQQSPATLFNVALLLANRPDVPPQLRLRLKEWLAQAADLKYLPQQMSKAMNQSGLFLESSLLNAHSNAFNGDLNALVRRIILQLQPAMDGKAPPSLQNPSTPPLPGMPHSPQPMPALALLANLPTSELLNTLGHEALHVLARIQTQQSTHVLQSEGAPYYLMLDLPIKTPEGVHTLPITIEQEHSVQPYAGKWKMSFAVELEQLGAIHAAISLQHQRLDVEIHAQEPSTLNLLALHQDRFSELITPLGLSLGQWRLNQGLPKNHAQKPMFPILDIKI